MSIRKLWCRLMKNYKFLPQKIYIKFFYEYYSGKRLDYNNPIEFNQKISWLKVFYHPKILNQLVDKYAVREYVKEKIGVKYLNECYAVYDCPSDINFEELPNSFVIKGVHGSGFNLLVQDKSTLNVDEALSKLVEWSKKNYYYQQGLEWAYKDVKPRFIAEKYLTEFEKGSITDYKFYCFNGEPKFVEVHLDRVEAHKSAFYDLEFNKLPFRDGPIDKWIVNDVIKPSNFEEMQELASKLADRLPFVRVDLYSIKNEIIFGEMTFYPADARDDFYPSEYNKIIGNYLELPKIKDGQKKITTY